jgi:hypothetical protein
MPATPSNHNATTSQQARKPRVQKGDLRVLWTAMGMLEAFQSNQADTVQAKADIMELKRQELIQQKVLQRATRCDLLLAAVLLLPLIALTSTIFAQ